MTDDKANASTADTVTITVEPPANTGPTADAGPDDTVASGASVTLDGSGSSDPDVGDTLSYAWTQTSGTSVTLTGGTTASPSFTAPVLGANDAAVELVFSLVVTDDKANASTADTVTITVNSGFTPAAEFEHAQAEIREIILNEALRGLESTVMANQRMVRDARERFIAGRREQILCYGAAATAACDTESFASQSIPFGVERTFQINGATLSTSGAFFGQASSLDGSSRRLIFGDFDIQHDGETGSSTATLTGRIAWERLVSDRTMLGYFIGGEVSQSNIAGAFEGDNRRLGLNRAGFAGG